MEKVHASKSNPMTDNCLDHFLFNFDVPNLANGFYLLAMENMFRIRDIMVKVEHYGTISRMLSWTLNERNVWVRDNLKNIDFALDFDKENIDSNLYI
jgi:hypothetical protein